MNQLFTVCDIETTGLDPEHDGLVEIACIDVDKNGVLGESRSSLIKPPIKIPPTASAIHHLTDFDVAKARSARDVVPEIMKPDSGAIYVAHQANFEISFLKSYVPDARWLCTYRAALRVWPSFSGHSVQILRYELNLAVERQLADQAHRALPDCHVTAHIFRELLAKATVEQMLHWTTEPPLLPTCTIGDDWRGKPWHEVSVDFLNWMIKKPVQADLVWNAKRELNRRETVAAVHQTAIIDDAQAARDTYVKMALSILTMSKTEADLVDWWEGEKTNRARHRVIQGTPEYATIVAACREHKATLLADTEQQTETA